MKKGLIVKSPWIEKILLGEKTWEIRRSKSNQRGKIYLIKSGSGNIYGECDVIDCKKITMDEFKDNINKHHVSDISLLKYPSDSIYAWVLDNPVMYKEPKPYIHPQGAIIWVNLP